MTGKEHWRKHVGTLNLEGFPKAWIQRGLQEIHHVNDNMDGRMDACLRYTAVLGAEIFELMGELRECHDFHHFTHFLLSLKRPNTRSNHDMALSYLILPFLILSFHTSKVTSSRRGKQIVLKNR